MNTVGKSQELPAALMFLQSQGSLDSDMSANQTPPTHLCTLPSPTSPPSPLSPATGASQELPTSPASDSSPAPPDSLPTVGKPDELNKVESKEETKDLGKEVAKTSSSAVMLTDIFPKTASSSLYAR